MAKFKGTETGIIISHWLTIKYTIEFLSGWEEMKSAQTDLSFHLRDG